MGHEPMGFHLFSLDASLSFSSYGYAKDDPWPNLEDFLALLLPQPRIYSSPYFGGTCFSFSFSLTGIIFIGGVGTICLLQTNAFIELSKRYTGEQIWKERKREGRSVRQFFRETFFPWGYD